MSSRNAPAFALAFLVTGIARALCQEPSDANRTRTEIQTVETMLPTLRDRGAALYYLAKRFAHLGVREKALELLKECTSLNEGFDPDVAAFDILKSLPKFQDLARLARRRYPPVHRAHVAFTIQQSDLFPEGLAVDSARHIFYMGSMHRRKIVEITEAGGVSDFVKPGLYDLMPVGGIKVDPADQSIWAATDPGENNRSEIVHFDSNAKLLERYAAPGAGSHDLNDLVIRNRREIYVTDTFASQVYRFDRDTHSFTPVMFSRAVLNPNGVVLSPDTNQLYVGDILGVVRLDLQHGNSQEVDPGKSNTLAGIDGLYWYKDSLVGVQYGTGSFRVARWRLSADGLRVIFTEILERRSPLISFPTTGAIYRDKFYFIANTGIGNLRDGQIVDPGKLEPIHIAALALK
jgi:sugar lactone lactonase YvrE